MKNIEDPNIQNESEARMRSLKETIGRIENMYVQAVELYLEEGDPLRDRILAYYSARPETEQELLTVLGNKNEDEISDYTSAVKGFTEDPTRFIERMEKLYELHSVHERRKDFAIKDRKATDEEYELGVYADVLESQVREAVFAAHKKGYLTFQSGFREKNERDQFMDFYNKNIVIPEKVLKYLQEKSIVAKIENFDDRTTLTLHPIGNSPIRLTEWKEIWNTIAEGLPPADPETVVDMKLYNEQVDFRERQDLLRK